MIAPESLAALPDEHRVYVDGLGEATLGACRKLEPVADTLEPTLRAPIAPAEPDSWVECDCDGGIPWCENEPNVCAKCGRDVTPPLHPPGGAA